MEILPEAGDAVQLVSGARGFATRVIRRLRGDIYVDGLGLPSLTAVAPGSLLGLRWEREDRWWVAPVRVLDILDPLTIVVVRAEGPAHPVEQRRSPRITVSLPMEYRLLRPDSRPVLASTLDISAVGLRFPAERQLWRGVSLRITLQIGGRTLALLGRVTRVDAQPRLIRGRQLWETAVEFYQVPAATRQTLETYIREVTRYREARAAGTAAPIDPGKEGGKADARPASAGA
ncbi:PilZ domain-containing protein [Candidatus Hydrogenisulfobacillus filiaventi]|uniref:PilZ domain-containing protein n=1 Tax=Candidatus Hydrogenisulfobacillus filiaventi TaxID=2707344 RepID=A0A6F8ZE97_9FIRM|nr:PilZ domain-containing protein [Bacillota bacterium]CAB1128014.1 PilZ domain-containing protein [Candidatus Hydrogenisulfobacillus filiaventi]